MVPPVECHAEGVGLIEGELALVAGELLGEVLRRPFPPLTLHVPGASECPGLPRCGGGHLHLHSTHLQGQLHPRPTPDERCKTLRVHLRAFPEELVLHDSREEPTLGHAPHHADELQVGFHCVGNIQGKGRSPLWEKCDEVALRRGGVYSDPDPSGKIRSKVTCKGSNSPLLSEKNCSSILFCSCHWASFALK